MTVIEYYVRDVRVGWYLCINFAQMAVSISFLPVFLTTQCVDKYVTRLQTQIAGFVVGRGWQ